MGSREKSTKAKYDIALIAILLLASIFSTIYVASTMRSIGSSSKFIDDTYIIRTKVIRNERGYKVIKRYKYKLIDSMEKVVRPGDGGFSTLEEV